jgi:hypothetical protein
MSAEIALLRGVGVRVDVQRVVRASLHTRLATDAAVAVEVHDAVVAPEQRGYRADRYARRVIAVVAAHHRKEAPRVGILAFLDVLDPGAKRSKWDFVFRFASYGASVAADALAMVDEEAVFHVGDGVDTALRGATRVVKLHDAGFIIKRVWSCEKRRALGNIRRDNKSQRQEVNGA